MATNATVTLRMDDSLKKQAEAVCADMGLTMSAAVTIFIKRMVRDRAIPFKVSAGDHFYSKENTQYLMDVAARMDTEKKNIAKNK